MRNVIPRLMCILGSLMMLLSGRGVATVTCKTCARELRRWGIAQPLVREG